MERSQQEERQARVASGDKVNGDEKYTFTVKPDADYIVESWKVDGQVIDSYSTSYEVTVKKEYRSFCTACSCIL
ncbi:MAG: hypothetical protein ACLTEE_01135 [Anaerobutyricum hallii]